MRPEGLAFGAHLFVLKILPLCFTESHIALRFPNDSFCKQTLKILDASDLQKALLKQAVPCAGTAKHDIVAVPFADDFLYVVLWLRHGNILLCRENRAVTVDRHLFRQ